MCVPRSVIFIAAVAMADEFAPLFIAARPSGQNAIKIYAGPKESQQNFDPIERR